MSYDPLIFPIPESVDPDKYVIATYYMEGDVNDILKRAEAIAVEQTTGTWTLVGEETRGVREKHVARVIGIYGIPAYQIPPAPSIRQFVLQLAFPVDNLADRISGLLSAILGNLTYDYIKLLDVRLPKEYVKNFKGPKFGIEGVRQLLGIYNRPLLNTMIKPCTGINAKTVAKLIYESAVGGVDIIKDDELNTDPKYCPFEERLSLGMEALDKAMQETGEKKLYTINVTDDIDNILEKAEKAVQLGANALMVDMVPVGFSVVKALAEDPSINVPILVHPTSWGSMTISHNSGTTDYVLYKLARMMGADMAIGPAVPYGKLPAFKHHYYLCAQVMRAPFYHIKRTFPMPSAGVHPAAVPLIIKDLGTDIIVAGGGAVFGHPMGPKNGAKAMRQVIDAALKGLSLEEAAEQYKELKVALDKWGYEPVLSVKI